MSANRVAASHTETAPNGQSLHISPALLPTQQIWIESPFVATPRLLLGRESLCLQGFPVGLRPGLLTEFPEALMADLAGNAMSLPIVLALCMSAIAAMPWNAEGASAPVVSSATELEQAMQMLAGLPSQAAEAALGSSSDDQSSPSAGADTKKRRNV